MIKCCFKPYQLYFSHTIARKVHWPIDWRLFCAALYSPCAGIVNTVCGISSTTSIWTTYMSKYTKWTGWQINAKLWDYNTSKVFKTWTEWQSILSLFIKNVQLFTCYPFQWLIRQLISFHQDYFPCYCMHALIIRT